MNFRKGHSLFQYLSLLKPLQKLCQNDICHKKKNIDQFTDLYVDQTLTAFGRTTHLIITAARFKKTKGRIWHRFHSSDHAQKPADILKF